MGFYPTETVLYWFRWLLYPGFRSDAHKHRFFGSFRSTKCHRSTYLPGPQDFQTELPCVTMPVNRSRLFRRFKPTALIAYVYMGATPLSECNRRFLPRSSGSLPPPGLCNRGCLVAYPGAPLLFARNHVNLTLSNQNHVNSTVCHAPPWQGRLAPNSWFPNRTCVFRSHPAL